MNVTVQRATRADASHVFTHLREEDRREVATALGTDPTPIFDLLMAGYKASRSAISIRVDKRCVAVFGINPSPIANVVWLLATDEVNQHRLRVLRTARRYAHRWFRAYGTLLCIADNRNLLHQRWIKLCGFIEAGDVWMEGHPFTKYLYYQQERK